MVDLDEEQRMCVYAPAPTHPSSLLLLFFGAFLLIFGLTSFLIRGRFFLTTAPLALVCGVALGPRGARWVPAVY
jgi:NhaP-type Na+/H+ or K+/H+ antiporter